MKKAVDRYAFALVLLAAGLLWLAPARADQAQPQLGTVIFRLAGRATSMNSTSSLGLATLDLTGGGLGDGQGGLMIQNLSGTLQIGFANYSIFTGDGKSDMLGNLMMLGESTSGELVLQGMIQHNSTVTTDATVSRLASLAYLALSGSMQLAEMPSGSATIGELTQKVVGTVGNVTSTSPSVNSTTVTQSASSSLSSEGNFTVQTEFSSENISSESNATSYGQIGPTLALPQQNITTQFGNHTITVYVSSTVANTTITETTTTTVAGTTTTVISFVTSSNRTVIVTNSTTSAT